MRAVTKIRRRERPARAGDVVPITGSRRRPHCASQATQRYACQRAAGMGPKADQYDYIWDNRAMAAERRDAKSEIATAARTAARGPADGLSRDFGRLQGLLSRLRKQPGDAALKEQYEKALAASVAARARRDSNAPAPSFDEEL